MKKDNSIELYRFIFTICVVLLHFGYFNGFYIAVDFFLILSGFLLCKSISSGEEHSTLYYVKRKIDRLYPHYLFSFLLMLIWNIQNNLANNVVMDQSFAADSFLESIFLQMLYPYSHVANGITWYLSALVICTPLLIYFLQHHRRVYVNIIAPYSALFIYAYFLTNWAHIDFGFVWIGFANGGLVRALAGMNAGVVAYAVYEHLMKRTFSKRFHNFLSICEIAIFGIVITCSSFWRQTKFDFIAIPLLMILVVITFIEKGFLNRILDKKVISYLGKLSYPIYLNQLFVGIYIAKFWYSPVNNTARSIVFVIVLILFSIITQKIVDSIMILIHRRLKKPKQPTLSI